MTNKQIKTLALYGAGLILLYCGITNFGTLVNMGKFTLSLFAPLIAGLVIAFVINIPMTIIESKLLMSIKNRLIRRMLSLILTIICFVLVVMFIVFMLSPALSESLRKLIVATQDFGKQIVALISELTEKYPEEMNKISEIFKTSAIPSTETIINTITGFIQKGLASITSSISFVISTFNGILSVFFAVMFSIYVLVTKEDMQSRSLRILNVTLKPTKVDRLCYVLKKSKQTFTNFITGQCIEAIIIGLLFFITLTVLGYPYPPLIGVTIASTALIPFIGPFIGCVISFFLILMVAPIKAVWFIAVFLIIQQIEGNLIYPRVVGDSVGLPPFWVLVAVLMGTGTLGVVGLLTFIPLFSIIYSLIWEKVEDMENEKKKQESVTELNITDSSIKPK